MKVLLFFLIIIGLLIFQKKPRENDIVDFSARAKKHHLTFIADLAGLPRNTSDPEDMRKMLHFISEGYWSFPNHPNLIDPESWEPSMALQYRYRLFFLPGQIDDVISRGLLQIKDGEIIFIQKTTG